jgi:hypothetical protein
MATAYGGPHVILSIGQVPANPPSITMYDATGTTLGSAWIYTEPTEASLTVNFESAVVNNHLGEPCFRRSKGESLEAQFTVRPRSSDGTPTIAEALKAATLPGEGYSFIVTGMKIIRGGKNFADGFNCTISTSPWFVESGTSLRGPSDDAATLTFTGRRYLSIANNTPVTE